MPQSRYNTKAQRLKRASKSYGQKSGRRVAASAAAAGAMKREEAAKKARAASVRRRVGRVRASEIKRTRRGSVK